MWHLGNRRTHTAEIIWINNFSGYLNLHSVHTYTHQSVQNCWSFHSSLGRRQSCSAISRNKGSPGGVSCRWMLWGSISRPAGDISKRQCQSVAFSDAGAGASSLLSGTYCFLEGKGVWEKLKNGTCCPYESLTFVINGRRKQLQNVQKHPPQALNASMLQSREITRILLPYS